MAIRETLASKVVRYIKNKRSPPQLQQAFVPQQTQTSNAQRMAQLRARKVQLQQQRRRVVAQPQANVNNAFIQRLLKRKNLYAYEEGRRQRLAYPKGYARAVNDMHDAERARKRKFQQDNSILRTHEAMDNRSMDFLSVNNSILMAENIYSKDNPRRMNIMKTGRPNVLQVPDDQNVLKSKHKLNFGKA